MVLSKLYSNVLLVLFLGTFFLACTSSPKETVNKPLAIATINMTKDNQGKAGAITETLDASAETFHCLVETSKKQAGAKITVTLIAVSAEGYENYEVRTLDQLTDSIATIYDFPFSLARPWFKGTYKCDVYLNDTLTQAKNFTLQ